MPKNVKATKTVNPLHFEDLEPHRFEDLVRRLLYGFRDWRELEPTGRGGSDEGFDIRAWEGTHDVTNTDEEGEEGVKSSEGNLWQVQGKREKSITPAKMRSIIEHDVDGEHPPYGYILAAATNITKATYDAFRAELRKKGVREFQFWGKDHLEDQLALPENDEILFTFFGISLSPRRRSRTAEIKFGLNNKNKILRILFGRDGDIDQALSNHESFLIRDIADREYPFEDGYPDFDRRPVWDEFEPEEAYATGVAFKIRERLAYLDRNAKEWDFIPVVDLRIRPHYLRRRNERREPDPTEELRRNAQHYWRHLPRANHAKLTVYGFVKFDDMLIIDEKGDPEFPMPHIFVEFQKGSPFSRTSASVSQGHWKPVHNTKLDREYRRIETFPKTFPKAKLKKPKEAATFGLSETDIARLEQRRGPIELYAFGDERLKLSEDDVIRIAKTEAHGVDSDYEVTHVYETTVANHTNGDQFSHDRLEEYADRKLGKKTKMVVYEICRIMIGVNDRIVYFDQ